MGFRIARGLVQYLRNQRQQPLPGDTIRAYLWLTVFGLFGIVVSAGIEVVVTPAVYDLVSL